MANVGIVLQYLYTCIGWPGHATTDHKHLIVCQVRIFSCESHVIPHVHVIAMPFIDAGAFVNDTVDTVIECMYS